MLARAYTLPLLLYGLQAPNRLLNNQAKVSKKKKQLPSKRNHQSPDLQIFLIDHSGDDIRFCHTSMLYSLARPAKPSRPDPAYPSSTQPPRKKPVKAGANRTDQLRFISSTSTRRRWWWERDTDIYTCMSRYATETRRRNRYLAMGWHRKHMEKPARIEIICYAPCTAYRSTRLGSSPVSIIVC
jgi:hypothetical protein